MKAVRTHEHGSPDVLKFEEIPRPEPESGEVLIEVKSTSVNVIDCLIRQGIVPESMEVEFPWVPGWDVSGVVKARASDVQTVEAGEPVYGMAQRPSSGETHAEFCALPAEHLIRKPDCLTHGQAAALPMAALTAHHALFEATSAEETESILIHAAAGGVGHLSVQLANHAGLTVFGTASSQNHAFLEERGANQVVDYRQERFEDVLDPVDLVVDGVGGAVLERSINFTKPGGHVVTLPQPPSDEQRNRATEQSVSVEFFSITSTTTPQEWRRLGALVREEVLSPTVGNRYDLSETSQAHSESEQGHVRGKIITEIG